MRIKKNKRRTLRTSYVTLSVVLLLPLLCCLLKGPDKEIEAKIRPVTLGLRGNILDRTGTLLAFSTLDKEGMPRRVYPYDDLAREIIGRVDVVGHGMAGIELSMEEGLWDGTDVSLTIERESQIRAEELLKLQLRQFRADYGLMAVMDSQTGEILAMTAKRRVKSGRGHNYLPGSYEDELFHAGLILLPLRWQKESSTREESLDESNKIRRLSKWVETHQGHLVWSPWDEEFISDSNTQNLHTKDLIALGFGNGPDKLPIYIKDTFDNPFLATPLHILKAFNQLLTGRTDVSPRLLKEETVGVEGPVIPLDKKSHNATTNLKGLFTRFPVPALASAWWYQTKEHKRKRCEILALGFWPKKNPRLVFVTAIKGALKDPKMRPGFLSRAKSVLRTAMEIPVAEPHLASNEED